MLQRVIDTGSDRGVTPVVGISILIGIVAIGAVGILLVSGATMDHYQTSSEEERVQQAMVEMSQASLAAATDRDTSRSVDFDVPGGAIIRDESATVTIGSAALDNISTSIGTVEWEGEDSTIAYESGAVFKETGTETRVVSNPPFHYDARTSTVTLPLLTVTGDGTIGSGEVSLEHATTDTYPDVTSIENEELYVTIENSDYCVGWETYFVELGGQGAIQEPCSEEGNVTARFGMIDLENAFNAGITTIDEDSYGEQGSPTVTDAVQHGQMPTMDDAIDQIIAGSKGDSNVTTLSSSGDYGDGHYFVDGDLSGDYEFDLSDGPALVAVDGDIANAEITVPDRGDDNALKIYSTGDFYSTEAWYDTYEDGQNASVIQTFGTSDMTIDFGPGNGLFYEGIIYAPSTRSSWNDFPVSRNNKGEDSQAAFHSNPNYFGALVVESVHLQGGAGGLGFEYDENLEGITIDAVPEEFDLSLPPQLSWLNVAHHEVEVDG